MTRDAATVRDPGSARYAYFDHDADVGVIGQGSCVEAAFVGAAQATFDLVTDIARVRPIEQLQIEFDEDDLGYALVTWLNLLIAYSQQRGLALGRFELARRGGRWRGSAWGEPWRDSLQRGVGVKGATLTMLSVRHAGDQWEARCVVDV